jgi:nicotinamidase-related amidase
VMDVQAGFLELVDDPGPVVDRAAAALDATRRAGHPVVHLRVAFPPGGPPLPAANPHGRAAVRGRMVGACSPSTPASSPPRSTWAEAYGMAPNCRSPASPRPGTM